MRTSWHTNTFIKALYSFSNTPSDTQLYDHLVTSHVGLCFHELIWNYKIHFFIKIYFHRKISLCKKILCNETLQLHSIWYVATVWFLMFVEFNFNEFRGPNYPQKFIEF